jgi:serine phosphatase RsbU (regulator of sigma subunit)
MEAARHATLRDDLLERRRRLEEATATIRETPASLARLIEQVDAALRRFEDGSYGLCATCHEDIEPERLMADPLVCNCLDHLTPEERRALELDLDLASRVQGGLLPQRDVRAGAWEVAYHYEPAGSVSGDYCDVLPPRNPGGDLLLLIGDVSGKGVAASMQMAGLRAIVRTLVESPLPIAALAGRANRLFCEGALPSHYATLALIRAAGDGMLEICNAGHPAPLVARGAEILMFDATGLPLGLFCSAEYAVKNVTLQRGDMALLYSDGLIEARDRHDAEYGVERIADLLGRSRDLPARALVDAAVRDIAAFRGGAPRTDDLTLMAVRRL